MLVGIAIEIPFAIGEAVLGVEAYLIRYQICLSQIFDQALPTFVKYMYLSNVNPSLCHLIQGLENAANGGLPAPSRPHWTLVTNDFTCVGITFGLTYFLISTVK